MASVLAEIKRIPGYQGVCSVTDVEIKASHSHNTTSLYFIEFLSELASDEFSTNYNKKMVDGWIWYLTRFPKRLVPASLCVNETKVVLE